jgi:hypothetical protein
VFTFYGPQRIAAPIFVSSDSGVSWTLTSAPTNMWSSVASSADGAKLFAGGNFLERTIFSTNPVPGGIFVSTNQGATWNLSSAPTNQWSSLACSADGSKIVAANSPLDPTVGGPIYRSTDSGATWTVTTAPSKHWSSVASSADGTKLVAVATYEYNDGSQEVPGLVYTSTDSGATWTPTSAPGNVWASVACSADGTKIVAAANSPDEPQLGDQGLIYRSTDSGLTWTPTGAPSNYWSSVASSADGTHLIAGVSQTSFGSLYISSDSGATWEETAAPLDYWVSVASSADGYRLVAAGFGWVCTLPYAGPWKLTGAPLAIWNILSCSADGTKLVAANEDHIYTSNDSGATWIQTAPTNFGGAGQVASSADGTGIVAAIGNLIFASTNSGATWYRTSASSNYWGSVAVSPDGTRWAAVAWMLLPPSWTEGDPSIYTSADLGQTWIPRSVPSTNCCFGVEYSADGTTLVVYGSADGLLYTSMDSGATWTQTTAPTNSGPSCADSTMLANEPAGDFGKVVCSSDGGKIFAAASPIGGPIVTLQSPPASPPPPPSPKLTIGFSEGGYKVSWLVPSTTFVLQESADLKAANWTTVPTAPTLNFTNLHYEVPLPLSSRVSFYRLKQQ